MPSAATFLIRMGQTAGYGYAPNIVWPKVFMATALDLANPPGTKCFMGCVHIFNKQAVAHRLVLAARSVVYGEMSLVYSGPRVEHVRFGGGSVTLTYGVGTEGKGLALRSGYGFEVCGADCNATASDPAVWRPAAVAASTRNTITITSPGFSSSNTIGAVRYAFDEMPSLFYGTQLAVYNGEGLPATPGVYFREKLGA